MKLCDDALLALKVMRWALANGWTVTRRLMSFDGYDRAVTWTGEKGPTTFEYFADGGNIVWDTSDVSVYSVQQAVDALVVLGHLPVEFSSAWAAGRESAYTTDEWRVRSSKLFREWSTNASREAAVDSLGTARHHYSDAWIEHRRSGATGWEKVTDA